MSKLQLKKELQRLTKEQLIEQITELYDAYKPVNVHKVISLYLSFHENHKKIEQILNCNQSA